MGGKIQSYLRTHRKQAGFTKKELSFLLGCYNGDGDKIYRFERGVRQPKLQDAFACEVVFGIPAHELFPGIYQKVEQEVLTRAQELLRKRDNGKFDHLADRKLQVLSQINVRVQPERHKEYEV